MVRKQTGWLTACVLAALITAGCGRQGASPAASAPESSAAAVQAAAEAGSQAESTAAEAGSEAGQSAAEPESKVAAADETVEAVQVVQDWMKPVPASALEDGVYAVAVDSSSSMFRITDCVLAVSGGSMSAKLTMSSDGYTRVYPGSAEEAAAAPEQDLIAAVPNQDSQATFTVPVPALDQGISLAAFSRRKEKWYDRTLVFRADSLPAEAFREGAGPEAQGTALLDLNLADGVYLVDCALSGGSGRTTVESPAELTVSGEEATLKLVFSSPNYDYVRIGDTRYEPVNETGNSTFLIPVGAMDAPLEIFADTTAMSKPHEIQYRLTLDSASLSSAPAASSSASQGQPSAEGPEAREERNFRQLKYAEELALEPFGEDCTLISIGGTEHYLLVPEGAEVPDSAGVLPGDCVILRRPIAGIYLAATSAMDFFRELGALESLAFSGISPGSAADPETEQAVSEGRIRYVGTYSAPDYEQLLSGGCTLAVESTMIGHKPAVKEQLERLGIAVMTERSSYEKNPLGRMEWIRLYGLLTGREREADAFFEGELSKLGSLEQPGSSGKTAACFSFSPNGYITVRRPGDYVSGIMELAGGETVFRDLPGAGSGESVTMRLQAEEFYAAAKDADILIYDGTISGEVGSVAELLKESSLLQDFKAVRSGQVWCAERDFFRTPTGTGEMIRELRRIFRGETEGDFRFFRRLS